MLTAILLGIIVLLLSALGISLFFLWKFAKIIMVFEDDIDDTLSALGDVEASIKGVINMPMFFDSPEVRESVEKVLEEIKLCRGTVIHLVQKFTERSKQQYVTTWEEEDEEGMEEQNYRQSIPRLPGQPPDTPNPLETIQKNSVVLETSHRGQQDQ